MSVSLRDADSGITREAYFFGPNEDKMFGCLDYGPGDARGGIVICPSLEREMMRTRRREVLLAHRLASRGFAVERFQYRGSGNSWGESEDATFFTMREDAISASTHLLDRIGTGNVAFLGFRLGALIAAAAAREFTDAPLVLLEPMTDADAYFREAIRRRLMKDLRTRPRKLGGPLAADALLEEMNRVGHLDIAGYPLHRAMYETWRGRTLVEEVGREPRPILWISLSEGSLRQREESIAGWHESGFVVETSSTEEAIDWWFPPIPFVPDERRPEVEQLVAEVVRWLERALLPGPATA